MQITKRQSILRRNRRAEWVVCDSRILLHASKLLKCPIREAIPGSGFLHNFYNYHKDDSACRIFLLGSAECVAEKAMRRINEKTGRRIVIGIHSPSFRFEQDETECRNLKNSADNLTASA